MPSGNFKSKTRRVMATAKMPSTRAVMRDFSIADVRRVRLSREANPVERRVLRFGKAPRVTWPHPFLSAFRLQHGRQPSGARARGRDFSSNSVTQPHAIETVAVMSNAFDGLQVHYGMPSDLDKRSAA